MRSLHQQNLLRIKECSNTISRQQTRFFFFYILMFHFVRITLKCQNDKTNTLSYSSRKFDIGMKCINSLHNICQSMNTGDSRYVDFAYLDTITYVELIFHSQHVFSMYLRISTPSMSKTVNMKQRVSRGDFLCP